MVGVHGGGDPVNDQNHDVRDFIAIGAGLYLASVHNRQMSQLPPLVRAEYSRYMRENLIKAVLWFVIPMGIAMATVDSASQIFVGLVGLTAFIVPCYYGSRVIPPVRLPQQRLDAAWDRYFRTQGTTLAEVRRYMAADARRQAAEAQAQRQAWRDHMDQTIRTWGDK